ncbi:E3 ubiquitin-protein ligase RNF216 [Pseudohyphozyma bogoriensis]|nr:E3 ubiquitin-protein ligase RNF216 [Pseudohyphozyma bogoriensis]
MLSSFLNRSDKRDRKDARRLLDTWPQGSSSSIIPSVPREPIVLTPTFHHLRGYLAYLERNPHHPHAWPRPTDEPTLEDDARLAFAVEQFLEAELETLESRDAKLARAMAAEVAREEEDRVYRRMVRKEEEERRTMEMLRKEESDRVAAVTGTLVCEVCYGEFDDAAEMVQCPECHLVCIGCARQGAEVALSQMDATLPCLVDADCPSAYAPSEMTKFLNTPALRKQYDTVRWANDTRAVPGFVSCPHCPYGVEVEGDNVKVLECQNPDCSKRTCLACQRPAHDPLSCAEANPTPLHALEERMSKALIRQCGRCGERYVKSGGCNKITCSNKTYICSQIIDGYGHFDRGPCLMYDDRSVQVGVEQAWKEGSAELKSAAERAQADKLKLKKGK